MAPGEPLRSVGVSRDGQGEESPEGAPEAVLTDPSKLLRIGMMTQEMLAQAHRTPLDAQALHRLKEIHLRSISALKEILPTELASELEELTLPFGDADPSDDELRVAQAQLVGWLQGVFHGIQASIFSRYLQSQAQAERGRRVFPGPGGYL